MTDTGDGHARGASGDNGASKGESSAVTEARKRIAAFVGRQRSTTVNEENSYEVGYLSLSCEWLADLHWGVPTPDRVGVLLKTHRVLATELWKHLTGEVTFNKKPNTVMKVYGAAWEDIDREEAERAKDVNRRRQRKRPNKP